jgi:predicted RNA methylase
MKISDAVLAVLSTMAVEGNVARITAKGDGPRGMLDRKLYEATNKVLAELGGKWTSGKVQGHVFSSDPTPLLEGVILTGEVTLAREELGYFPTPLPIVMELIARADIREGMRVLEPSAGEGHIAREFLITCREIVMVEIDAGRVKKLRDPASSLSGQTIFEADFLKLQPDEAGFRGLFDRVVMNPPFASGQDLAHVTHALKFLKPGGRLVSVMASSVTFREDRKYKGFREMVKDYGGTIRPNPEGSFRQSGTGVNTVIVTIDKP